MVSTPSLMAELAQRGFSNIGLWTRGWRMLPLGLALIALTTLGYFMLPNHFLYWMAGVGGGGLILGGLWLRSA